MTKVCIPKKDEVAKTDEAVAKMDFFKTDPFIVFL